MNGRGISRPYNKRLLSCPSAPTDKLKPQPRQPESNRNNAILHAHGGRRIVPIGSIIVPHEGTAEGLRQGPGFQKKDTSGLGRILQGPIRELYSKKPSWIWISKWDIQAPGFSLSRP